VVIIEIKGCVRLESWGTSLILIMVSHLWALCGVKTDVTNVIESKGEGFTYFTYQGRGNYNVHMSKLRGLAESRPPFWKCAPLLGFTYCKA
jgi:hypothetical protein